jgi:hypothetical protein
MSLTNLLKEIGDDNIEYQMIEKSLLKAKKSKRHGDIELTIVTDKDIINGCGKVGIVLWIDKNKLESELNKVE